MIPFSAGAFLPAEQRYTSPIFRRLHRIDRAEWLSLSEAAELVAMMRLLGPRIADYVFQWSVPRRKQARRLLSHPPVVAASEPYLQANMLALSEEDGEAALQAMFDGGWRRGQVPAFVRRYLQACRGRGESAERIAERLGHGVSRFQVQRWITPQRPRRKTAENRRFALVG